MDALLKRLGRQFGQGCLEFRAADGRTWTIGHNEPRAVLRLHKPEALLGILLNPNLRFAESYMEGVWEPLDGDLRRVLEVAIQMATSAHSGPFGRALGNLFSWFGELNNPLRSRSNVHAHYDLDYALYSRFLDRDMQYSCAYFRRPDMTLEEAQTAKRDHIADKLRLSPGQSVLDIGCGAGLLCEPLSRLGAQVIGVDPSASNIAAAKLHADKSHLAIDYRCTTVEEIDPRERFDIVLAMEVVEHVVDVGVFLKRCASMLKPNGLMVVSTLNRNWKSFALAIVGAEYVLRWLPRGTHEWNKFVTPDELTKYLLDNRLVITEQTGVVYSPFADKWTLSSDMDVNYMVVAEGMV